MPIRASLIIAGLGLAALAGCAEPGPVATGTSTTSVTRDAYGNPIAANTTVRDAYGNVVSSTPGAAPVYGQSAYGAPAPIYQAPVYPNAPAVARVQDPRCQPTALHQDRPGGSDYNPYRGAPSC
jgi:hypothetical protein